MAREGGKLEPGERLLVPTGIAVAIPPGHGGLVIPRSGLAARHGLSVVNGPGLIDSGYRGEIKVILVNLGTETFAFDRGERIAQLMIVPVPESARGLGGFGSTGRASASGRIEPGD